MTSSWYSGLKLTSSTLERNKAIKAGFAESAMGGALFLSGPAEIHGCVLADNVASAPLTSMGGALYHYASRNKPLQLSLSTFLRNTAFKGGAVVVQGNQAQQLLDSCYFKANIAHDPQQKGISGSSGGGSMAVAPSAAIFRKCTWEGNSAIRGGGMLVSGVGSNPLLENCALMRNRATGIDAGGGALAITASAHPQLMGCTLEHNTGDYGGAVVVSDALMTWSNNIR